MTQLSLSVDALLRTPVPAGWRPDPFPNLKGVTEVAKDYETTGLRWWGGDEPCGVALAWRDPETGELKSCYLPTGHEGGNNHDPERVKEFVRTELAGKAWYNLNTKFDAHMGRVWGADVSRVVSRAGDVAHYAALLDDHRRHFSLEAIAQSLLGEGKVKGLDLSNGAHVYPAHMVTPYARQDASLVLRILDAQRPQLEAQELQRVVDLEDAVFWPTVEMERNAAPLDVEKLDRWERESRLKMEALRLRITFAAGHPVDVDSAQSMAALFRERGLKSDRYTETCPACGQKSKDPVPPECEKCGGPRTASYSGDVLERCAGDPVVGLALQQAHLADLRSKYLLPYQAGVDRSTGLLRFSLNQLRGDEYGTVSGRYSSSKPIKNSPEGGAIQIVLALDKQLRTHCHACWSTWRNTGSDSEKVAAHYASHEEAHVVRELFVPAPGKRLARADAKQIEYRVFAHMTGAQRLFDAYAEDPDLDYHALVGEMVHRFRPDFERKRVKNINFARLFGAGIKKIAGMLGVSVAEARSLVAVYDEAMPEAGRLMSLAAETAKTRGHVRTLSGRRARFNPCARHGWGGAPRDTYCGGCPRLHSALNRAIQGSAADINKAKLVELYAERERLGFTMRMTVHDEVVGDLEDDAAAPALGELLNRQAYPLNVPILWDVQTGANWAECK